MNAMLKATPVAVSPIAEGPMPAVIAKLMALHSEAEDTARLVNLLQRTIYCAIALPLITAAAIAASRHFGSATVSWIVLMLVATGAVSRTYLMAYNAPYEREALQAFEDDLGKVLLLSGVAWGMGAFLTMPVHASAGMMTAFATTPCLLLAVLLRARLPVLLFVAPVAVLGSLACVIWSDSAFGAVLALLGCGAAAAIAIAADRGGPAINSSMAGLSLTSRVFSVVTQR